METPNANQIYNGVKFYGASDLGAGRQLQKAETVLNCFAPTKEYENINEIIELYNIQELLDSGVSLKSWTREQEEKYKSISLTFTAIIGKFFSHIDDENFLETVSAVSNTYTKDFWTLFSRFKIYKHISSNIFENCLSLSHADLGKILEHKNIVDYFGPQLANILRTSSQTAQLLIEKYLKKSDQKYYLPKEFKPEEFEPIFLKYIQSDHSNPNLLQLIYNGQSSKECPLSEKLRLKARNAFKQYWENHKESVVSTGYKISVGFVKQDSVKAQTLANSNYHLTYDINWLEENLDYPTILNNFFYLFEMFDSHFRSSLVSVKSQIGVLEEAIMPQGIKFYRKGIQFNVKNNTANVQTTLYYDFLKSHGIELEEVFKWFFEIYLPEEFGVNGFSMSPSSPSTSYLDKCRILASEMDGILKQFRMYVVDGEIDRELFEMKSEHTIISSIPSLIHRKYAYPNSDEILSEMHLLFSDQTILSYIERTGSKYSTLYDLLLNEKVYFADFVGWQQQHIQWLRERGCLSLSEDGLLEPIFERIWILKDIYENDVACVNTSLFPSVIDEMISAGDLRVESTLFSEPEQDYLNYMLNKSEFSNGLDLRNKYIHASYSQNEDAQRRDYITFLKLMVLVVTKINDEFCTWDSQKKKVHNL